MISFTEERKGLSETGKTIVAIYTKLGEVAQTVASQEIIVKTKRPNTEKRFQLELEKEKKRREEHDEPLMTAEEINQLKDDITTNPVPTPIGNATAIFSQMQRGLSENKEFQELVKQYVNESVSDSKVQSFRTDFDPRSLT